MKLNYFKLIWKHKWYVFKAGLRVKVPIWQLLVHDLSKLLPSELINYQKGFFGSGAQFETDFDRSQYRNKAWFLHQKRNKHHWDYWITITPHMVGVQGGFFPVAVPMPEKYIREMVADWMGAGMAYTGADNLQEWLRKNYSGMRFHIETHKKLEKILEEVGYYWPGLSW